MRSEDRRGGVLVLAGTADGREIVGDLSAAGVRVVASVTSGLGADLLRGAAEVRRGRLGADGMADLAEEEGLRYVVDATHPYATEASTNAIAASSKLGLAYLRFERPGSDLSSRNVVVAPSAEAAAKLADELAHGESDSPGTILLTTGSKDIAVFVAGVRDFRRRLYVRVLPASEVIAACEAAGLPAANIIAMQGPFTEEMNLALLRYSRASVLVTKDGGAIGGTPEKISAAARLSLPVIVIERPRLDYPRQTSDRAEVLRFVQEACAQSGSLRRPLR